MFRWRYWLSMAEDIHFVCVSAWLSSRILILIVSLGLRWGIALKQCWRKKIFLDFLVRAIMSSISKHSFSANALIERHAVLDGYLLKRGKINTNYQKRWFILYSNNTLSYYQDSITNAPLGEISLYSVTNIKEEKNNVFHLITSKRTFIQINSDKFTWSDALCCACIRKNVAESHHCHL